MAISYLLLGGNIGDTRSVFISSLNQITEQVGTILQSSAVYSSKAWGFTSDQDFLNQVIKIDTPHTPFQLLDLLQEIERKAGRIKPASTKHTGYQSRILDLDILFYDIEIIETERLILPHPLLHLRRFTLIPLSEIAPDLKHPILGLSIANLLAVCPQE